MSFSLTTNHGSGSTGSQAIGTAVAGDLMILGFLNFTGAALTLTTITDTVGTSYTPSYFGFSGGTYALVWGFLAGSGANTLTTAWSSGSSNLILWAEFNGSSVSGATVDGTVQTATGSGTTATTPSITTTGTDDLIVDYVWQNQGSTTFGGSWSTAVTLGFNGGLAYQADVAASTYSPNVTFSVTGSFVSMCIAFKAAAAAAAAVLPPQRTPLGL